MAQVPSQRAAQVADRAAGNLRRADRAAISAAAEIATDSINNTTRQRWGSLTVRNLGRNGASLKVRTRFLRSNGSEGVSISPRPAGAFVLVDQGAEAHEIGPRKRNAKRLKFPDGEVRRTVHHPGFRGTQAWQAGRAAAAPRITATVTKTYDTAIRQATR